MISDILESLGEMGETRLVELGKIKVGGLGPTKTAQSGRTYRAPRKDDHFTITTLHREPNGDLKPDTVLMESLIKQWGDQDGKLRQIPIYLLSDDIEDVLQVAHVWYAGKQCGARSDGKATTWYIDPRTKHRLDPPQVKEYDPEILNWKIGEARAFKTHSVFNCVIAAEHSRWGGVYKFRTTSIISLKQLYSSLVHISQLTGGVLIGMPLMLKVRPVQVSPNGQVSTVQVVHVELMGKDLFEIQKRALIQAEYKTVHRQKLLEAQTQYRKLLCGPGQEKNGEVESINAEFHPETIDMDAPAAPEGGYSLLDDDAGSAAPPVSQSPPDVPAASKANDSDTSRPDEVGSGEGGFDGEENEPDVPEVEPEPPEVDPQLAYEAWYDETRQMYLDDGGKAASWPNAFKKYLVAVAKVGKPQTLTDAERKEIVEMVQAKRGHFAR